MLGTALKSAIKTKGSENNIMNIMNNMGPFNNFQHTYEQVVSSDENYTLCKQRFHI